LKSSQKFQGDIDVWVYNGKRKNVVSLSEAATESCESPTFPMFAHGVGAGGLFRCGSFLLTWPTFIDRTTFAGKHIHITMFLSINKLESARIRKTVLTDEDLFLRIVLREFLYFISETCLVQ
jgi:hypothetical protein